MGRDEAIEYLSELLKDFSASGDVDAVQAIDMAIEALEEKGATHESKA